MLILSRKQGERINIGDNIMVEVRRVAGNRVSLAVDAPPEVRILRTEVAEAPDFVPRPRRPYASPDELDNMTGL